MEENKLVLIEQNITELHNRLPRDIAVMNGLAQALEKIEKLLPEYQDFKVSIAEVKNYLSNEFSSIRKEFGENLEKSLTEWQLIFSQGLEKIESKLEIEIDNLRIQQHKAEQKIQDELFTLKNLLNSYKQEQQSLYSQVSKLQYEKQSFCSIIKQLQEDNIQLKEEFKQLLFEFNLSNQKHEKIEIQPLQPITQGSVFSEQQETKICTHEGNLLGALFCKHCGEPLQVIKQIRQYQVLQVIAEEKVSNIYIACVKTNRISNPYQQFILEEMNIDLTQINQCKKTVIEMGNTFKNLLARGIPKFFDLFVEGEKKYLVTERLFGQNLHQYIHVQGAVSSQQAIKWMIEVCEVLEYLHNQQPSILHGNIQPMNLLLRKLDNRLILQNFKAIKKIGMPVSIFQNSDIYTAPEEKNGQLLIQSDIYAIGVTLIFLLTGQNPETFYYQGDGSKQFHLQNVYNITENLQTIIWQATQSHPSGRYQTAKELVRALEACL